MASIQGWHKTKPTRKSAHLTNENKKAQYMTCFIVDQIAEKMFIDINVLAQFGNIEKIYTQFRNQELHFSPVHK